MTEITTDNTFDEIELAIRAVPYPSKPQRPTLPPRGSNAAAMRSHADELDRYATAMESYEASRVAYQEATNALGTIWREKARQDFAPNYTDAAWDRLMSKAWQDGHSNGYSEVRWHLDELVAFVNDMVKAMNAPKATGVRKSRATCD